MDTPRRLHLLAAGDVAAWPDLSRDLERRCDAENAAEALTLLHAHGHAAEAAQWLNRLYDTDTLQDLRAALLALAEGWPVNRLRALTLDLLHDAYRLIPAGSFVMGSPPNEKGREDNETQHLVEITQPFLLKTTLVTQAEWQAEMGINRSTFQGDDSHPAEMVSWYDAAHFCEVLSARTGDLYRLPTEAEWEYAARAGTTTPYYGDLNAIAWYGWNANRTTHPVGGKQPNAWGLYDMIGNVAEWCHDWDSAYPSAPQRDPTGDPDGFYRMIRGGDFCVDAHGSRVAQRFNCAPSSRQYNIGFRPVRALR